MTPKTEKEDQRAPRAARQAWTRPTLKYVGNVGDVLQGGGGKLTPSPADSGDSRKPPGQG
jgi:hypothetical protein